MMSRCYDINNKDYSHYGGRGIRVCKRWHNIEKYREDMLSGRKPGLQIDRIDNDGDYSPKNCRWTTKIEQMNNTRKNKFIEYEGKNMTLAQWSRKLGIRTKTLYQRFYTYNWTIEKCFNYGLKG